MKDFKKSKFKSLSIEEFNKAAKKTTKKERTLAMAKSVLVGGVSAAEVARTYNSSRQLVFNAANHIYGIHIILKGAPEGWIEVKEFFPPEVAKDVLKMAKDLLIAEYSGDNENESKTAKKKTVKK